MTNAPVVQHPPGGYRCYRCGWKWMPRKPEYPRVCPHCHSRRWYDTRNDEEHYWNWLEWAVGMDWFAFFRLAAKAGRGEATADEARRLIRRVTDRAVKRAREDRPGWKRPKA